MGSMAAKRYQEGSVEITGKKQDTWTGYYYVYDPEGFRHRRSVNLGTSKGVSRKQAKGLLRPIVEKETARPLRAAGEDLFKWYYWNRFSPTQDWKKKTRRLVDGAFRLHVLPEIGDLPLKDIDKYRTRFLFDHCAHLSQSYLNTIRTFLKAVFDAALEDDLIVKNPITKKLKARTTSTVARAERVLTPDELQRFFAELDFRDKLICRIAVILGLRPGEIFALTWSRYDSQNCLLTIDQSYGENQLSSPKTASSIARMAVPPSIARGLEEWRQLAPPGEYLFTTQKGRPIETNYFQSYIMVRAAIRAGIMEPRPKGLPKGTVWTKKETAVNFQAMRRTCGTESARTGSVKDVQTILRHAKGNAAVALKHYIKPIDETVRATMLNVDAMVSAIIDTPSTLTM
jgi:integrase